MRYIPITDIAVAIFPHAMIARVAIRNPSMIVPESPISHRLDISRRVIKNVTGIIIARITRRKWLFSSAAGDISVRKSLIARPPRMINDMSENPPVRPGTPSEKFTALNTRTYQKTVMRIGRR
jgi:hypothetical protein